MQDQRALWIEIEKLQTKVGEFERQQQQGCQLQDPPPPIVATDHAIVMSRKRHHLGCTSSHTTIDP